MDFDLRSSVHHSAKHLSRVQASRLHSDDYSVFQYTDVDDDPQSHFRCPFCDFAIQVRVLCSNLEEEHCPDLKNVVCPVCDQNLGRDVIRQFTHSNPRKLCLARNWLQWETSKNQCRIRFCHRLSATCQSQALMTSTLMKTPAPARRT